MVWFSTPASVRKHPLTLSLVLAGLSAFSLSLFVGGTAELVRMVKTVASAPVKGQEGRGRILEGPEPAVPAVYVDPRLVGAGRDFPPYHLVWRLGELSHGIQHVGYGALADVQPEDGLEQVGETLEQDVLIGAQIRCQGHDVGPVGHGAFTLSGKRPLQQCPHVHLTCI